MTPPSKNVNSDWEMWLHSELTEIKVAIQNVKGALVPRAEIEADLDRRVAVDTYTSDQKSINERIMRIESSPIRMLAWLGAATGCLGLLAAFLGVVTTIIIAILNHH